MTPMLSAHFSIEELIRSTVGQRLGIDNTPSAQILDNLYTLAGGLERVRFVLGATMHIDSGYRCPKLNAELKGAKDSAHMKGLAGDFIAPDFGTPAEIVDAIVAQKEAVGFNRVIMEGSWVHIDFPPEGEAPKFTVLTAHFGPGGTTYSLGT